MDDRDLHPSPAPSPAPGPDPAPGPGLDAGPGTDADPGFGRELDRVRALGRQGYQCAQILLLRGLELRGEHDPGLIRSMRGLCDGIGVGETCGALTGGACLLALNAGGVGPEDGDGPEPAAGSPPGTGDDDDPRLTLMREDLLTWFRAESGPGRGGLRCADIAGPDGQWAPQRCPPLVAAVFRKVTDLLVQNGFEPTGMRR
ncbi:MAG: C-GCAxxG-C-C family protein [Kineosporiaceae bacterium]